MATEEQHGAVEKENEDDQPPPQSDNHDNVKTLASSPKIKVPLKRHIEKKKKKKKLRLWTDEDELSIVQGLADLAPNTATSNYSRKFITTFYSYVKKFLHFDATRIQVGRKIRKLRSKYKANAASGNPSFFTLHEKKIFQISEKVWGNDGSNEEKEEPTPNKKPEKELNPTDSSDKCVGVGGLNVLNDDLVVKLIGESKKAELESRWKKLQVEGLELFVKRAKLMEDQAALILKAYRESSNH